MTVKTIALITLALLAALDKPILGGVLTASVAHVGVPNLIGMACLAWVFGNVLREIHDWVYYFIESRVLYYDVRWLI